MNSTGTSGVSPGVGIARPPGATLLLDNQKARSRALIERWLPATGARSPSGEDRANRFMLILLALQRLSYLPPTVLSLTANGYRSSPLNAVLVAGTLGWNVALFWRARTRGWFSAWMTWADVGWATVLLVAVTLNSPGGELHETLNWSTRWGQAAAALGGAALAPLVAAGAVGVLVAAHSSATVAAWDSREGLVSELVSCVNGLIWFAVIIGFGLRYLRRQGRRLDEANSRRLAAESARAADHATYELRMSHFRALHDTVLATLTAIARGADVRSEQVRDRCAREARYIRRMLTSGVASDPGALGEQLGEVIGSAEAVGLRVHYLRDDLPDDLPQPVARAFAQATAEALNNVHKHAGTAEAWLTVTTQDGGITLTVVDRGRGFAPDRPTTGFGLRRSVTEPVTAVGGAVEVHSVPGDGTRVELRWSPVPAEVGAAP